MSILWLKALHVFFMVAWMAGIFYLPRLFVHHAMTDHQETKERFKIMERKLWYFVTPFAFLTLFFGIWLIHAYGYAWFKQSIWLHVKITLVLFLYVYHFYLFYLFKQFEKDANRHSHKFYRFLNESPVVFVFAIIVLAIVKPF